jgi:DNA-binding protein H-NS
MSKHHTKKRIKNKHQHHEDMLRQKIEEEVFAETSEQMTKYQKRIDYLIGGNNELASMLKVAEDKVRKLEENRVGCISIPNATADCILLENTEEGFENF